MRKPSKTAKVKKNLAVQFRPGVVIGIDFDGTCVAHAYPGIGEDIGAVPVLRRIVEAGGLLVLFTMRDNAELREAVEWFSKNGIALYGIQRNPTQAKWTTSPKAYANIYIDDAALGCPLIVPQGKRPHVDWSTVELMLFAGAERGPNE